jgi:outer membrane protein assembly factor BamB
MRNQLLLLASFVLLVVAVVGQAAPAPETKEVDKSQPIPGGVASADGNRGFVRNETGGVTALDLETGKSLWTFKPDSRVLALRGGRVLVQTRDKENVLRILGLDADKGEKVWESDPITLPDWVRAIPGRWGGYSFTSSSRLDQNDLLLSWQAATWYWGGARPSPEREKAARHNADGVARIDLESGKVEMLETAKAPPPPTVKPIKEIEKAAAQLFPDQKLDASKVTKVGNLAIAVFPNMGEKPNTVVMRWDMKAEKMLDPIVLKDAAETRLMASAGVVLARRATMAGQPAGKETTWDAFSLETGKQSRTFSVETRASDLTVVGPRAFYMIQAEHKGPAFGGGVIPRTVKAIDLKTGKQVWELPLEGERLPPPPPP